MADDIQDSLQAALAALQPEIRQMLAEDLPVDSQRCRDAFAGRRWGELREYVHRIKGTASFCHLEALRGICTRIEDRLAAEIPPDTEAIAEFSKQVDIVLAALQP